MKNNLKFEFKSKKIPKKGLAFQLVISVIIIGGVFVFVEKEDWLRFSFLFFYLPIMIVIELVKVVKYNKTKYAILLSNDSVFYSHYSLEVKWAEVERITYIIRNVSSYLIVELKNEGRFIKNQKWNKKMGLYFNNWRFKTPFVINLEYIEGEADVNYKKIESYIEENKLIK